MIKLERLFWEINMSVSKRNYGIDLLRIVSMYMICMLHVLGNGGILASTSSGTLKFHIVWFLESCCFCAVNCYALISGYVGIDAKFKITNILKLWLQVVSLMMGTVFIFALLYPSLITKDIILRSIFPISNQEMWYFNAYFGMFFFIPFMNKLVHGLTEKMKLYLIGLIALLFSIVPFVIGKDIFNIDGGYHFVWIMGLYLIGASLKGTKFEKELKEKN